MKLECKRKLEKIVNRLPSPKLLLIGIFAILFSATAYVVILFLLSK